MSKFHSFGDFIIVFLGLSFKPTKLEFSSVFVFVSLLTDIFCGCCRQLFLCVGVGLWAGLIIGFVTEYYTSNAYR